MQCWMEPCTPPLAEPFLGSQGWGALITAQHSTVGFVSPGTALTACFLNVQCKFDVKIGASKQKYVGVPLSCLMGGVSDWRYPTQKQSQVPLVSLMMLTWLGGSLAPAARLPGSARMALSCLLWLGKGKGYVWSRGSRKHGWTPECCRGVNVAFVGLSTRVLDMPAFSWVPTAGGQPGGWDSLGLGWSGQEAQTSWSSVRLWKHRN